MRKYNVRNILVPMDFSPISRNALQHAERIAEFTQAHITLLHVVEPIAEVLSADAEMVTAAAGLVRELEIRGSKALERISRVSMQRTGTDIDSITAIGPIAATITAKASKTQADLIIMGTHGTGGFVENLVGSTTYRVSTQSRIPVLSVRSPIGRSGYGNVIYPVRSNVRAMDKFPHALLFAKLFEARVHVVGLLQPGRTTPEKKIRGLCVALKTRFAKDGIETKTVFASTQQLAEAVIRYVQVYSGSFVVINQDYDFRLVEMFQGTFPKRIMQKVFSPVLTVPR
jgi:nucleotide-binding universal stress UspA family protein